MDNVQDTLLNSRLTALHACMDSLADSHDTQQLIERLPHLLSSHFSIGQTRLLLIGSGDSAPYQLTANTETTQDKETAALSDKGMAQLISRQNSASHNAANHTDKGSNQLTLPILLHGRLLGLLQVVSPASYHFTSDDEKSLAIVAHYLAIRLPSTTTVNTTGCSVVRHYADDNTIFIDENYLIKGVAGAILWKLVCEYRDNQRSEFCNRELRRDPTLGLPEVLENLESRLILLQRRLNERCPFLAIEKTGRGRFRFRVDRQLKLSEV